MNRKTKEYSYSYSYLGIYTDMDNAPGYGFLNGTVIGDDHDSFFEVERDGFPSQYFFAGKFMFIALITSA